jgi:putative ABC transport system permease protein
MAWPEVLAEVWALMFAIGVRMLLHKRSRFLFANAGIAVAFFLSAAQFGLMVGWCNTCSALIRHADVDLWVMAPKTPAYDYGSPIPRHRIQQVRNCPGVRWAEGLFMAWNTWQRPDGRRVSIELVGLDDSCVGGPWEMLAGATEAIHGPDAVVIDDLYLGVLGIRGPGDAVEMTGNRAIVRGVSRGIRTLTASPFIFTSIRSAIRYDKRYQDDEITYVLARCAPGVTPEEARDAVARQVPNVEVLTSREFAIRTMKYWMLETGLGITVVLTAFLGLAVAAVIVSQTLFAITQDHLSNYGTLLALGFSRAQLCSIVLVQGLLLGCGGVLLGSLAYGYAARLTATTPIPLETTGLIYAALVGVCLGCSVLASFVSVRSIFRIDPVSVFRI